MKYTGQQFVTPEEALQHYGVLGMKWGVRKDNRPQGYGNPNYRGPRRAAKAVANAVRAKASRPKTETQSFKARTAQRTTHGLVAAGGAATGRMLGASVGKAVLGPDLGGLVGGFVGARVGATLATKSIAKKQELNKKTALSNINKAIPNRNEKYTENMAKRDINNWDVESAKRINASMNSGMTRSQAVSEESSFRFKSTAIAFGASFATSMVANQAMSRVNVGDLKQKAYGAAINYAQDRNARATGPDNLKYAKKRRGAYNVTSLK